MNTSLRFCAQLAVLLTSTGSLLFLMCNLYHKTRAFVFAVPPMLFCPQRQITQQMLNWRGSALL